MAPTIISTLATKGYFSEFRPSHIPTVNSSVEEFGMVYTEITPRKKGIVRFKHAWWFALSNDNMTIDPGQNVRVIELHGSTLLVEFCH
ncbi:NfeD family protein [Leptolyngbya cf. ectocarpi LEGE 11479]|uniref:NfeD family protein n=1 Tax=Leptolyngbya cf. ectocarpi LEGE 11479 TaxID=1828722 RepID=A0A928X0A4_LEPEC|nr:NfeD family protein [Leptolyngbya ectocarpi]MBE9066654.1 NfeD family protein [Leptolyngbya cf. ectocarpi LEGE 11479]